MQVKDFQIQKIPSNLDQDIHLKIDFKTKPLGALGLLENIAFKVARIQQSLSPQLNNPHIIVFAADHGIAEEGVSKYPQEVTYQMVLNFVNGGAAINTFCRQHDIRLKIVDAGVKGNFDHFPEVINQKISEGTGNFFKTLAMGTGQCVRAIESGSAIVDNVFESGCNVIGFGEMGIANTTSAAALMHLITNIPLEDCVGRGTGLDDGQLQHKLNVIKQSIINRKDDLEKIKEVLPYPLSYLSVFGGFEIAQMAGAMMQAAENKMIVLIDGFIATSALLITHALYPQVLDYCLFAHQSDESGHVKMLNYLHADPILKMQLRLGEGTGCALSYPLIVSAVNFLNEMASFEDASVSHE